MGRQTTFLALLSLASRVPAPETDNPAIAVSLRLNNVNGLTVVVQCDWGSPCSGCHIDWLINGRAVSGPVYIQQFEESVGFGSLIFPANSYYDGAYVSCVFRILLEDNTFHSYISKSANISLEGLATTTVASVTSENSSAIDDVEDEDSLSESGSDLEFSNGTEFLNNKDEGIQRTFVWNIGVSAGVPGAIAMAITSFVIVGLLLWCARKRKRSYNAKNNDVEKPEEKNQPEKQSQDNVVRQESVITPVTETRKVNQTYTFPTSSVSRDTHGFFIPVNEDTKVESTSRPSCDVAQQVCSDSMTTHPSGEDEDSGFKPLPTSEDVSEVNPCSCPCGGDQGLQAFLSTHS